MGAFLNDEEAEDSPERLSAFFTIFGQFVDHDLDLTPTQRGDDAEKANIIIPDGDQFFPNGSAISFTRSQFIIDPDNGQRQQLNSITPWLDGGQIYGSDD